jgi:glycyl-tRNA synthetase beta subunit
MADLPTVSIVTAALSGKRYRATIGGEWKVASFIVDRMTKALKCRAADDLLLTADSHQGAINVYSKVNRNALLKANITASKVDQILEASERVGNLQLISAKDNQSKNGIAFDSWITSRDDAF